MMNGRHVQLSILGLVVVFLILYISELLPGYNLKSDEDYGILANQIKELKNNLKQKENNELEIKTLNNVLNKRVDGLMEKIQSIVNQKEVELNVENSNSEMGLTKVIYTQDESVVFLSSPLSIRLWIDVPNAFPWRKCLHEYASSLFTHSCDPTKDYEKEKQSIILKTFEEDKSKFQLMLEIRNAEMNKNCIQPDDEKNIKIVADCSSSGYWQWTSRGLLRWKNEGCLASTTAQAKTVLVECDHNYDDQMVEIGKVNKTATPATIEPLDLEFWQKRMDQSRKEELESAKKEVDVVLEEIKRSEDNGDYGKFEGNRRAVVFFVDKGSGFLAYLSWWIFAWRKISLDSEKESFDIVLMTHPDSIKKLPKECKEVPQDYDPKSAGPGQCLYRELVPISERNHKYDSYLNSQECLANPAASFLKEYKILIRADLDTFPTPGMINLWPRDVICNRNAVTTHYRKNIEDPIIATAAAAGITHKHWHNTDSAWMGPALRIIALSKLTTYLARFTRAHMFGPGTLCRCATCINLPQECEWGQGIYAGTLLLYAQEIAMNRMWSQREYDTQKTAILDASCTELNIHVCQVALMHARHNSDPFSKFNFLRGDYKHWEMKDLDITNVQGYAMYMAIASANQGKNANETMERYLEKSGGTSLGDICESREDSPGKTFN